MASEEIFGPVLIPQARAGGGVRACEQHSLRLERGVWTDKVIFKLVNKPRASVVWANTYNKFDPTNPLGGYKESGFGREGGL